MPHSGQSYRPSSLLIKLLAVLVVYQTFQQTTSADSTVDIGFSRASQGLVADRLKTSFFKSNLMPERQSEMSANLKRFQSRLLRLRNSNCSNKEDEDFDEFLISRLGQLNSSRIWRNASESWRALEASLLSGIKPDSQLTNVADQLNEMCLDSTLLMQLFNASVGGDAVENYENLFQLVLTQLDNNGCNFCDESKRGTQKSSVPKIHSWGYGILLVTIISASSLCGALVIPFSKKSFYKRVLMFLIALAVGSLAGSGFLHLIPQAFGITEDDNYSLNHDYVWKGLVMMGGVYLFYVVEKALKIMILRRKAMKRSPSAGNELYRANVNNEDENPGDASANGPSDNQHMLESIAYVKTREKPVELSVEMRTHLNQQILSQSNERNNTAKDDHHGHSHFVENLSTVEPVAWMIIFGDGLHNFIDGLSIGAAFTDSVIKGISISLAVICEEFPHELGDFAILINAGMSFKTALIFNFASACSCYIGLAVGIVLGDNLNANKWIYAIAGGMFLYISLCDMIPELNELGDEIEKDFHANANLNKTNDEERTLSNPALGKLPEPFDLRIKLKILVIQNIGIITGFSFMLIMAIYSGSISL